MDQSLTIAYVLPDDNEHASDAFSIPATRKSGAACAVKWDGPESGHELAVNEQTMRAYAARPRVAFTITREAPPVVPVPGDGDGGDAGTEGEPAQPPTEDDPTSPSRGEPIVSVVEVELASVMLGSRRAATVTFGEKHHSSDDAEVLRLSAPPMPEALRGFAWATITVSLDAFGPDENDAGSTEPEKEAEKEKTEKTFLPPGLASAMEPFAVTVETATSLPEAPATRADLSLCAPVKCLVRWAGMPVATMEATFGETDWVASLDADGGSGSSAFETRRFPDGKTNDVHEKKKTLSKKPRAYATARGFHGDASRTHARDVTFGKSVIWFGCDVPFHSYPLGLVSACREAVQVRVYDRSAPREAEPFAAASDDAADLTASDANALLNVTDDEGGENAEKTKADVGTDEETDVSAAREAERRALLRAEFPETDAAYGFASFDVSHLARRSNAPITPRALASMEAPLVPCAMSRSGAASWRTRPGRFVEAGSTVTLTLEMAVPPRERAPPEAEEAAAEAAEGSNAGGADAERLEADGEPNESGTEPSPSDSESPTIPLDVSGEETALRQDTSLERGGPFVRATCTFPSADVSFMRAVVAATREQNAKALNVTEKEKQNDARLRFELARAEVSHAQALDPSFHLVTGYHLNDGEFRQITVEGTPEAVAPVVALFARRRGENASEKTDGTTDPGKTRVVMDFSKRFAERAYHLPSKRPRTTTENDENNEQKTFAGDFFFAHGVRLRDSLANIVAEPGTHVGDRVAHEAREGVRRVRALAEKGTRARRATESNLYPETEHLRALDRAFGVALRSEDVCADAVDEKTRTTSRRPSNHPSLDDGGDEKDERDEPYSSLAPPSASIRVKKHPPLTIENSAYLASLARKRLYRNARDINAEVHQSTIDRFSQTKGAARREAWAEWNVWRPPRDAFESELETARRHATASTKPVPPPTPAWGKTHDAPFTWPTAHDAATRRVPAAKRLPQSRVEELAQPWEEPAGDHFATKYFASSFFPGGTLDLTKSRSSERRGGEVVVFPKPFEARVRNESRSGVFDANARERALWENPEEATRREARRAREEKTRTGSRKNMHAPWRDANAPRLKAPAQTDKTRGVLRDPPKKKALVGKYVRGAAAPPPHSMFLEEPPVDLNGLSLDETFSRSLRLGAMDAGAFLTGSTRRTDPSTFVAGKDFVRHNVGNKSLSHTGRSAGVGEVATPRTRAQRRA